MDQKQSFTDVLIVGAGAAGTMAAACAAAYGLNACIIDKCPQKLAAGHGDGLHARMMEILDTFGLADAVLQHGNEFTMTHSWVQCSDGRVTRQAASSRTWEPPSPFTSVGLTQAKMADILLDYVRQHSDIEVERGVMTESISVQQGNEYPVRVTVRNISTNGGMASFTADNDIRVDNDEELLATTGRPGVQAEIIKARYVVACDGAHSWIRRNLQIPMIGDDMDVIWGIMDIHPFTDFRQWRSSLNISMIWC